MRQLCLALVVLRSVALLRPVGDANAWHRQGRREVCLLPFPLCDGLLPGEALQIHLWERSQRALFEASCQLHGCIGMLLERPPSSADGSPSYAAVAPLLELREHQPTSGGVWCSFTCVGAVRLSAVELRTAAEQRALDGGTAEAVAAAGCRPGREEEYSEPFLVAQALLLREEGSSIDHDSADDEDAFLSIEVSRLHEEVNELRRRTLELDRELEHRAPLTASERITSGGDRLGPPPPASDRVRYGYRLGPLVGPYLSVDELVRLRLDSLSVRGVDEVPPPPGSPTSNRLHELIGTADDESLRRRVLSFAAVEALHEHVRVGALAHEDTAARLQHAHAALQARKKALAAEVSMRDVLAEAWSK